ncbi:MAG: hypothetical protein Q4F41_06305, partial [Eubacteriales bacterium]|nr:hypothetical protein [Eubacteriales bacterium]
DVSDGLKGDDLSSHQPVPKAVTVWRKGDVLASNQPVPESGFPFGGKGIFTERRKEGTTYGRNL